MSDAHSDYLRAPAGEPLRYLLEHDLIDTSECKRWPFSTHPHGYGKVYVGGRNWTVTHLVLLMAGVERPSPRHGALHSCDTPRCFNRRHLRWGTPAQNAADKVKRSRQRSGFKVGESQVLEIVARCAAGEAQTAVAHDFGISQSQVSRIANAKSRRGLLTGGGAT